MESVYEINPPQPDQTSGAKLRFTASIASAVIPGLGQIFLRKYLAAIVFFALVTCLIICYFVGLPKTYFGLIFLILSGLTLHITSTFHAVFTQSNIRSISKWWLVVFLPVGLVAGCIASPLLLRASGFHVFTVTSTSMSPTIVEGDKIVCAMQHDGSAARSIGKIVIFRHKGIILVKRLIAVGGDTVYGLVGHVSVNGKKLDESYAVIDSDMPTDLANFGPIKVPNGEVFLLGDNRSLSLDSRAAEFGSVKKNDVIGTALYIFDSKQDRTGRKLR